MSGGLNILILSASVGAGHTHAATALEAAFRNTHKTHLVQHLDTLDYATKLLRTVYSKGYSYAARRLPTLTDSLYKALDRPRRHTSLSLAFERLNTRRFAIMLRDCKPDLVICTHFLPAQILSSLVEFRQLAIRYSVVVTDFDVHSIWITRHCERYFVATDDARMHLEALGISADRVSVTGIPIDPVFSVAKDRRDMRRKYGLDKDRPTILVSGGRFDLHVVEQITKSLAALPREAQVVVLMGPKEERRNKMQQAAVRLCLETRVTFKFVGFVEYMNELMAACDLVVGRPGGLITSEALASGLVFVIVNPIPGQEERNADYLLMENAAIRCHNLSVLSDKIEGLLGDIPRLETMKKNVARIARPRAAFDIVETLLEAGSRPVFFH
ncbi:MAG TPA: glycosyltransferase [Pyrinomonadaceae bacterium]|nr:glycosyltransferase [Pyrinomonadaceae bacterium]